MSSTEKEKALIGVEWVFEAPDTEWLLKSLERVWFFSLLVFSGEAGDDGGDGDDLPRGDIEGGGNREGAMRF